MAAIVVLHGGGTTAPETTRRVIALAGGPQATLVVLAHTGEDVAAKGKRSADWLRENGAKSVVAPVSVRDALTALEDAAGVWIPGGDQNLLMRAFAGTDLPARLRGKKVVGGTSAGASLMGSRMPTGQGDATRMRGGSVGSEPALGVLANTLVDTHFFVRQRTQRLLNLVHFQPVGFLGLGVDENAWCEREEGGLRVRAGQVLWMQRQQGEITLKILEAGSFTFMP